MIMATSAGHGQTHQSTRDNIDLIVHDVMLIAIPHSDRQEAQSCKLRIVRRKIELVSRQLLDDKLIIRNVVVEGFDNVVAIRVGKRKGSKTDRSSTMRVRISSNIQPILPPTLTVLC